MTAPAPRTTTPFRRRQRLQKHQGHQGPQRRTVAAVTAMAVGAGLLVGAAQQASAAPAAPDLTRAVAYLTDSSQLVDGRYYAPFGGGFADWGLTIDGGFALAATGGNDRAYQKLVDGLDKNTPSESGNTVVDWAGLGSEYAEGGSIGKLALLAEVAGRDPHSFAGHDLIAELGKLVCTGTTPIGESPCYGKGNYAGGSSVFKQTLGIMAQVRGGAGDAAVAAPTSFLLSLQNTDGGFPSLIPADGGASDIDSTAMAVMALSLVPGDTNAAAAEKGIAWVAGQQLPDGAFGGFAPPGSEPAHSTNSTALAIQALALSTTDHSATNAKARTFLASRQNADGGFTVNSDPSESDVRASTQVVNGLVGRSYATLLHDLGAKGKAATGAAYLVKQLTDGTHLESSYPGSDGGTISFVDYGLTADLGLALASTKSQNAALAKVVGYLRAHVDDYVDPSAAAGGPYGGAAGKLAVLAQATGQDPTSFGSTDLIAQLTGNVCSSKSADAYGPCSAAGDFGGAYSGASQALGVLALGRARVAVPPAALTRLEQLQCGDGGFSSTLIDPGADCTSDVDTTGYALQALSLQPSASDAVARGWAYLREAQDASGGWTGTSGINSNSTGLAAQAVLALVQKGGYVGTPAAAGKATTKAKSAVVKAAIPGASTPAGSVDGLAAAYRFLESLQRADGGFDVSTTTPGDEGTRTRASTQAVPALAGAVLTTVLDPIVPVDPPTPTTTTEPTTTQPTTTQPTTTQPTTTQPTTSQPTSTTTQPVPTTSATTAPGTSTATSTTTAAPVPSGGSTTDGQVTASGDLPSTGSPAGLMVVVGLLLVLAGLALLLARRIRVGGVSR